MTFRVTGSAIFNVGTFQNTGELSAGSVDMTAKSVSIGNDSKDLFDTSKIDVKKIASLFNEMKEVINIQSNVIRLHEIRINDLENKLQLKVKEENKIEIIDSVAHLKNSLFMLKIRLFQFAQEYQNQKDKKKINSLELKVILEDVIDELKRTDSYLVGILILKWLKLISIMNDDIVAALNIIHTRVDKSIKDNTNSINILDMETVRESISKIIFSPKRSSIISIEELNLNLNFKINLFGL